MVNNYPSPESISTTAVKKTVVGFLVPEYTGIVIENNTHAWREYGGEISFMSHLSFSPVRFGQQQSMARVIRNPNYNTRVVVNPRQESVDKANPIVLVIKNYSNDTTYNNINLFDAGNSLYKSQFGEESHLSIESGIDGVSYTQLLQQSIHKPFLIGEMGVIFEADKFQKHFTLINTSESGMTTHQVILLHTSPYDFYNMGRTEHEFKIDSFTNLRLSSIVPNETIKVYLYNKLVDNNIRGFDAPKQNPTETGEDNYAIKVPMHFRKRTAKEIVLDAARNLMGRC